MANAEGEWIWHDGQWLRWHEATVHVSTHALHYGSSVFEGIRCYATPRGPAIFRLREHVRRLHDSARLARIDLSAWPREVLEEACVEVVRRNHRPSGEDEKAGACYLRPIAFRGAGGLGVDGRQCPVSVAILSLEWGAYLGPEAVEKGVDARVSSWRRLGSNAFAPMGKIGGQYVNNQWVSMEAHDGGFAEGILLDPQGMVSEGGGENLFLIRDGVILTPTVSSSILSGITRDAVITLAHDLGYEVRETSIPRDLLYLCDEMFMTGTAAEVTPVRSVDGLPVGAGERGPITHRLQEAFFALVSGRGDDRHGWLTPVEDSSDTEPATARTDWMAMEAGR